MSRSLCRKIDREISFYQHGARSTRGYSLTDGFPSNEFEKRVMSKIEGIHIEQDAKHHISTTAVRENDHDANV